MTLDPVHVDEIARLADRITRGVDPADHRAFAETAWAEFLDPLYREGEPVLEPIGEQRRLSVPVDDAALQAEPFETRHGLDAGTINPTAFENGLVVDVAQAAMAAVPSDLDCHRARTIVATVHTNDASIPIDEEWRRFDEGFGRRRALRVPSVERYERDVVHALALYLAESSHALEHADAVSGCLILDGPVYPAGLLRWADHHAELADLLVEADVRAVVENYVRLVESFLDRGVPLVGFVKSTTTKALTRAIRAEHGSAPWNDDEGFFRRVLERRDEDGDVDDDRLTFTNWFRSRVGTDAVMGTDGGALGIERERDPADYEVTFMVVYDPRTDLLFRVEAPYGVTRDEATREAITDQVLADVASQRGPPLPVAKADELARIGVAEKRALRRRIEERFDSRRRREYDDQRWGSERGSVE